MLETLPRACLLRAAMVGFLKVVTAGFTVLCFACRYRKKNSSMTKVEKMEWRERERREKEMREGGREGGRGREREEEGQGEREK